MAPLNKLQEKYDYICIGGGSGGVASSRRAASYAKKLPLSNRRRTSAIMWHAADLADRLRHASKGYHFQMFLHPSSTGHPSSRSVMHTSAVECIYEKNLEKEKVDITVAPPNVIAGDYITVATGGRPTIPSEDQIPGASLGIDSDGFFDLEDQPKRVAVIGAGYIAVELAGVLHTLGSETHVLIRRERVLRTFDPILQDTLTPWMEHTGINIHKNTSVLKVEGQKGGELTVHLNDGTQLKVDTVLWAIGRHANTEGLGLEELGIQLDKRATSSLMSGRRLCLISLQSVIFRVGDYQTGCLGLHPTIGTVGLTEPEARQKYGSAVKIYKSSFRSLYFSQIDESTRSQPCTSSSLLAKEERVVGVHIIGQGSDEVLQGFCGGSRKQDLDDTVAIHPTSAEELVTLR
ncbi:hypothetical protein DFH29DRAFT_907210 [Suillus ampliporus]|nr:hypothetical protein DFH29DRAFT_907210 [Suillus ampliporus]